MEECPALQAPSKDDMASTIIVWGAQYEYCQVIHEIAVDCLKRK